VRHPLGLLGALALAIALLLAGCGGSDDNGAPPDASTTTSDTPIRIGAKNFPEQAILGELYSQALKAKGFDVDLISDIGSTEIIHRALRRGALDMYPEYIGVLLSEVAEKRERPPSAAAAYELAQEYENRNGFTLLAQTPFSDANALAVKPNFARRHRLRTIGDLDRLKGKVKIAALAEFETRFEGLEGLLEVYGLRNLDVLEVKGDERYTALDGGSTDVASVFTTESQLVGNDYVVLGDPEGLFASGHVAPIVSDELLKTHGADLRSAVDAVTRTLTTPEMREMNAAVVVAKRSPAAVATQFLRSEGLL
jgi:osmoprotectant transport system substrate-binding protein